MEEIDKKVCLKKINKDKKSTKKIFVKLKNSFRYVNVTMINDTVF